MVRTTTGAADAPAPKVAGKTETSADKSMKKSIDVDDATWGRIQSQASIQQSEPGDVVRRAIEQAYGVDNPTGALNSGEKTDPNSYSAPNS